MLDICTQSTPFLVVGLALATAVFSLLPFVSLHLDRTSHLSSVHVRVAQDPMALKNSVLFPRIYIRHDTNVATVETRVRARPAACFPRLEGSGTGQCSGCGVSWNR